MDRGILSTSYANPTRATSTEALLSLYREFYADEPFVRVLAGLPATKHVVGHEFLRPHGPRRPRPRGRLQRDRQPHQGGVRGGGAELQSDDGIPETTALL